MSKFDFGTFRSSSLPDVTTCEDCFGKELFEITNCNTCDGTGHIREVIIGEKFESVSSSGSNEAIFQEGESGDNGWKTEEGQSILNALRGRGQHSGKAKSSGDGDSDELGGDSGQGGNGGSAGQDHPALGGRQDGTGQAV